MHRRLYGQTGLALAAAAALFTGSAAQAAIQTAGELVVDLRAMDLDGGSTTWMNQDTAGDTVGDFSTVGGDNLNVEGIGSVSKALHVAADVSQAVLSTSDTPASLNGNSTRSVEAWLYNVSSPSGATPVGWGTSGNNMLSSFRYNGLSNGMFSGWFNDVGWGGAALPTGEWVHVAWTYDGDDVRGYINGVLQQTAALPADLETPEALLVVGAGREGVTDPIDGYIADVRVHTGVLSDAQVQNNFSEGIAVPEPASLGLLAAAGLMFAGRRRARG